MLETVLPQLRCSTSHSVPLNEKVTFRLAPNTCLTGPRRNVRHSRETRETRVVMGPPSRRHSERSGVKCGVPVQGGDHTNVTMQEDERHRPIVTWRNRQGWADLETSGQAPGRRGCFGADAWGRPVVNVSAKRSAI